MIRIVCAADCGNAPRKKLIYDLLVSLAIGDLDQVASSFSSSAMTCVYSADQVGITVPIMEYLKTTFTQSFDEVSIDGLLSHGKDCAAYFQLRNENHEFVFGAFFTFTGNTVKAKIGRMTVFQFGH